ncbi:hypothetical protein [Bradyrhizobium tunisiense]|uniref:hypothetical protein n=1 Tax=Bradyrhizobium tunisiense TaxID=3278709 RepID=UPI0035D8242B
MQPSTAAVRLLAGDKEPVRLASTANLALSGLSTVDGISAMKGDRVLVKDQTDARQNGIYTASEGRWYRAPDSNSPRTLQRGMKVSVQEGATHADETWTLATDRPVVGSDEIEWVFFISADVVARLHQSVDDIIGTAIALTNAADFASEMIAAGTNLPSGMTYLRTAGLTAAGDGGGALYKKVVSEPSHNGKFQSADGAWWEIVADETFAIVTANYSIPTTIDVSVILAGTGSSGLFTVTLGVASSYPPGATVTVVNGDAGRGKKLAGFPGGLTMLWPGQAVTVKNLNGAWVLSQNPGRWRLTGAVSFYVDPVNGLDTNDGLAAASGAFQTLTGAYETICKSTDFAGQTVTMQLANGTYTSGLNSTLGPLNSSYGGFIINGNATTPDNVLVSVGATGACFSWFQTGSQAVVVWIKNLKMQSTGADLIRAQAAGTYIRVSNVNFGSAGSGGVHMRAYNFGEIDAFNDSYKITGGGGCHYATNGNGIIGVQNQIVNITGPMTFTSAFAVADGGQVLVQGDTYNVTGTITGTRYIARNLGLIDTAGGGASYFPGTVAGAATANGYYN